MKIILASESKRRQNLLRQAGLEFIVIPADIEEKIDFKKKPVKNARELSYKKARYTAQKAGSDCLIIGADTIVVNGNNIFTKPENEEHAFKMLSILSGRWHTVITGITVINTRNDIVLTGNEKTKVKFKYLSNKMIKEYIKTKEPMDKAGAYGIQGYGALLVERINGCYYNVMGLPLVKLSKMIKKASGDLDLLPSLWKY